VRWLCLSVNELSLCALKTDALPYPRLSVAPLVNIHTRVLSLSLWSIRTWQSWRSFLSHKHTHTHTNVRTIIYAPINGLFRAGALSRAPCVAMYRVRHYTHTHTHTYTCSTNNTYTHSNTTTTITIKCVKRMRNTAHIHIKNEAIHSTF